MADFLLLGLTAVAAVVDWSSVIRDRPKTEAVAKPLVMVGLLAYTLASSADGNVVLWVALALLFGLAGDISLLPALDKFELGLGSFGVGHLMYILAAIALPQSSPWSFVIGALWAVGAIAVVAKPILASLEGSRLRIPVVAYMTVIAAMLVAVSYTGVALAIIGAALFAVSDALLGYTRFVTKDDNFRWLVHVTYHTGQALLVVGLLNAVGG